jgi:hypothetical protein
MAIRTAICLEDGGLSDTIARDEKLTDAARAQIVATARDALAQMDPDHDTNA